MKYSGSGSLQDLAKARTECVQKDPCLNSFDSCVASKGFTRSKSGRLDASNMGVNAASGCYAGGGNRAMGDALQKIGRDLVNPPNTGGYTQKIGPNGNIWTCLNGICQ